MNILKMAPVSSMSRAFKGAVKSFVKWRNSALKSAPRHLTKNNLQRTLFFYPKIPMKKKLWFQGNYKSRYDPMIKELPIWPLSLNSRI